MVVQVLIPLRVTRLFVLPATEADATPEATVLIPLRVTRLFVPVACRGRPRAGSARLNPSQGHPPLRTITPVQIAKDLGIRLNPSQGHPPLRT